MSVENIRFSKSAHEHSIWFMPSGDTYRQLSAMISHLSNEYGSPTFEPHVTLLGGLVDTEEELVSKTLQLAALSRPFTVELSQVEYQDEFYRALFFRVKETAPLLQANHTARVVFDRLGDPVFMPHLSLMYGEFPPMLKEEIIARLGRQPECRFQVAAFHLVSTAGDTKEWYRVRDFAIA